MNIAVVQNMLTTSNKCCQDVSQEERALSILFDQVQKLRRMEFGELTIVKHQNVFRIALTTKTQIQG